MVCSVGYLVPDQHRPKTEGVTEWPLVVSWMCSEGELGTCSAPTSGGVYFPHRDLWDVRRFGVSQLCGIKLFGVKNRSPGPGMEWCFEEHMKLGMLGSFKIRSEPELT